MIQYQSIQASGVAKVRVCNAATLSVGAANGKIYSFYAASNNTVPVFLQVFDLAAMPSTGAWPTGITPILMDFIVGNTTTFNGTFQPISFAIPIPTLLGCQMVLSTSSTSIVLDTLPIFLGCQWVPDVVYAGALPAGSGLGVGS